METKFNKLNLMALLVLPSVMYSSIVSYECRSYACFLEFEKKYGITKYDAKEIEFNVWQFTYDTDDTFEGRKLKAKADKKKNVLDLYETSLLAYKNKEYQKAYDGFNTLFQKELNNVNVNFFLGQSAYMLKDYEEAIFAYERVLFEKPESTRTRFQLAVANLKLEQYNEAKKHLIMLKDNPKLDGKVKQRIDDFLAFIDTKTKKHFLSGLFLFGVNYDSNINSDPDNLLLTSGLRSKVESASAHQEVVMLNHKFILDETQSFKNDVMLFNKGMFKSEYSNNDVQLISYTPTYVKAYTDKINVDYSAFIDNLRIDGKDTMTSYGIHPKLQYLVDKFYTYDIDFKYQDKAHKQQADKLRDSVYIQVNGGVKYQQDDKNTYGAHLNISQERKDKDGRADIDKDSLGLVFDYTWIYDARFNLATKLSYKQTDYLDVDSIENKKREDTQTRLGFTGTYIHSPVWIFQGLVDTTSNDSNFKTSVYDKNTFTINAIRIFK